MRRRVKTPTAAVVALGVLVGGCSPATAPETTPTTIPSPTTTAPPTMTTAQPTTTSPVESGMAVGEQIPGTAIWSLVSGNDLDADRINLLFAPWGWDHYDDFEATAAGVLSWDGDAYWFEDDGALTADPDAAAGAQIGVFGIEPWRWSRDKFNVWITDVEPETPVQWLNQEDPPFDLPDLAVVTLAHHAFVEDHNLFSVAGLEVHFVGPDPPERPLVGTPFANAMVVVPATYPAVGLRAVPHELGHALFNLADEYVGEMLGFDGREDLSSWPSCAEDQTEADEWWGDLVGDVDPMVEIWAAEMKEAGFSIGDPADLVFFIEVSNVDGGCYHIDGSVRATFDSLMNDDMPVLGSVNRRWAEQILGLWEGAPRS